MAQSPRPSNVEHPLALGSFRVWIALLVRSGGIDREYVWRVLFVTLSTLLTSPLRVWERARYARAVRRTRIHPAPIFIVGHWRSGTTYLHNLLCQDQNFGFLTTFQAMAPGFCLTGDGMIKRLLARATAARHPTRVTPQAWCHTLHRTWRQACSDDHSLGSTTHPPQAQAEPSWESLLPALPS